MANGCRRSRTAAVETRNVEIHVSNSECWRENLAADMEVRQRARRVPQIAAKGLHTESGVSGERLHRDAPAH